VPQKIKPPAERSTVASRRQNLRDVSQCSHCW
jgi:hypothetical protein